MLAEIMNAVRCAPARPALAGRNPMLAHEDAMQDELPFG